MSAQHTPRPLAITSQMGAEAFRLIDRWLWQEFIKDGRRMSLADQKTLWNALCAAGANHIVCDQEGVSCVADLPKATTP